MFLGKTVKKLIKIVKVKKKICPQCRSDYRKERRFKMGHQKYKRSKNHGKSLKGGGEKQLFYVVPSRCYHKEKTVCCKKHSHAPGQYFQEEAMGSHFEKLDNEFDEQIEKLKLLTNKLLTERFSAMLEEGMDKLAGVLLMHKYTPDKVGPVKVNMKFVLEHHPKGFEVSATIEMSGSKPKPSAVMVKEWEENYQ